MAVAVEVLLLVLAVQQGLFVSSELRSSGVAFQCTLEGEGEPPR